MGSMMDELWLNSQQKQEIFLYPEQVGGQNPTYYTMGTGVKAAGS